jgi:hypothetical protein
MSADLFSQLNFRILTRVVHAFNISPAGRYCDWWEMPWPERASRNDKFEAFMLEIYPLCTILNYLFIGGSPEVRYGKKNQWN